MFTPPSSACPSTVDLLTFPNVFLYETFFRHMHVSIIYWNNVFIIVNNNLKGFFFFWNACWQLCMWLKSRVGSHDNVPDRPSAMVASVGCQLATMALTLKLSLSQNVGCTAEVVTEFGTSLHLGREERETGGLSAILPVNRLGRCHASP